MVERMEVCPKATLNDGQLDACLELREQAMAKTTPAHIRPARYQPDDAMLTFLNNLCLFRVRCIIEPERRRTLYDQLGIIRGAE